jgi:hypothetical protein
MRVDIGNCVACLRVSVLIIANDHLFAVSVQGEVVPTVFGDNSETISAEEVWFIGGSGAH